MLSPLPAAAAIMPLHASCRYIEQYLTRAEAKLGELIDAGCVVSCVMTKGSVSLR